MADILAREGIYLWHYLSILLWQVAPYWVLGMVLGSAASVFGKAPLERLLTRLQPQRLGLWGLVPAALLGALSPLCMYGTVPVAAALSQRGLRQDWLAAFLMTSVLLNPQLVAYSLVLGPTLVVVRLLSCLACGLLAGLLVHWFGRGQPFFNTTAFVLPTSRDSHPNPWLRYLYSLGRNLGATGGYFAAGLLLAALFQRYVPAQWVSGLFGPQRGFGVLLAATLGAPLYACGGGTIPLLLGWLQSGMSLGAATAFMVTGPATKLTNLGALATLLGWRRLVCYLVYVWGFAWCAGLLVNLLV